jgi:C-terminal processing protease CtpA/Prc
VNKAIANRRKKMIIDVTSNPGGVIDSGFALLSVFFPNKTIYSATRFRSYPAVDLITQVYSTGDNPEVEGTPFFLLA